MYNSVDLIIKYEIHVVKLIALLCAPNKEAVIEYTEVTQITNHYSDYIHNSDCFY